jgi:inosine/xanthosine triphosphatase
MKAVLGGTFNVIHDGHKALMQRAFELSDDVLIGLTTDQFASVGRKRVNPYYLRMKALVLYMESIKRHADVVPISDMYGSLLTLEKGFLVVSRETEENAAEINKKRIEAGLEPMIVSVIEMVKGRSGAELHASGIISGECSRTGDKEAMDIAVGSLNPVKIEAVRTIMERVFGNVRIIPAEVDSGVPEQPFGDDTRKGAVNRAKAALGDHSLSVGIEAGVFEMYGNLYDVQHCAVIDRNGTITTGMSSGFRYPDKIADMVRNGMSVGKAMAAVYAMSMGEGAIGVLSKGLLDRKTLTEQSITAAMIPRIWDEP